MGSSFIFYNTQGKCLCLIRFVEVLRFSLIGAACTCILWSEEWHRRVLAHQVIVRYSRILQASCQTTGHLKLATEGVFTPWKLASLPTFLGSSLPAHYWLFALLRPSEVSFPRNTSPNRNQDWGKSGLNAGEATNKLSGFERKL